MNEMKTLTLNGKTYDSFRDQTAQEALKNLSGSGLSPEQAAQLHQNTVEIARLSTELASKITGVHLGASTNLFNKATITGSSIIWYTDGSLKTGDNYSIYVVSDFIPVKPNTNYFRTNTTAFKYGAYYDGEKNYIAGIQETPAITTPDGAYYVRFSFPAGQEDLVMLVEGTAAPGEYIPYKEESGTKIDDFQGTFTENAKQQITAYVNANSVSGSWSGKKVLCIGDSLTKAGVWYKQLENLLGMKTYKKAIGGMNLERVFTSDQFLDNDGNASAITSADVADKDLIIFFVGTNNRTISDGESAGVGNYTIGQVGDVWDVGKVPYSIAALVQHSIDKLYDLLREANNLTCRMMFVTPYFAGKCADRNYDGSQDYNGNGVSLKAIAEIMEKVCRANGIPCYNAYENSGINPNTWPVYTRFTQPETGGVVNDMLHLNTDVGYPHLGRCIAKFVAAN